VVESQPSKLLVAGSIPVSRSNLRSWLHAKVAHRSAKRQGGAVASVNELRLAAQMKVAGLLRELVVKRVTR
jgi:hypothetical protein